MSTAPDYLNPGILAGLRRCRIPIVDATAETLENFGFLVSDPKQTEIEIVRWPAQGWRSIDSDCGDQAGTTEGIFTSEWKGDVLYGRNAAVAGHYVLGYGTEPTEADENHARDPTTLLLWHANYHPDGGQLFFPEVQKPFLAPLAKPDEDVKPEDFVCFRFDGKQGFYIHPNVWHEGVFALKGEHRFFDKQGAVHARVSVDFPREFNCLLEVSLEEAL